MLMSVKRLLRTNGYDTVLFSSAKAFKNHDDFGDAACVILDINLNDGSGIELSYGLKAAGNSVPVIYITGNDTPAVRKAALDSGCIAFLTKAIFSSGADRAAQESWQASQQRGQALTHQRLCHAICGASVSRDVSSSHFYCARLPWFRLGPIGKLAGCRRELRLRSDLQLFHHCLTLRCDEVGVAAELFGNLFVSFSFGEANQQLLLVPRQLVFR